MKYSMGLVSLNQQIKQYQKAFEEDRLPKPDRCQLCGGAGPLHWHAIYKRSLICFHEMVFLPIRRVLCSACRKTFASLPDFVLKFHRYAKAVIHFALRRLTRRSYNAVADLLMDRCHRDVATLTLYLWRRRSVRSPA